MADSDAPDAIEASDEPTPRRSRRSVLYDADSGKLDVKRLAKWIGSVAALIAALGVISTQVGGWVKWWLDIDDLETQVQACDDDLEALEASIPASWRDRDEHDGPLRDPNARLDDVLPVVTGELRTARGERQHLTTGVTRLSTIHEFGLTRTRERQAAQEAAQAVQTPDRPPRPDRPLRPGVGAARRTGGGADGPPDDPLSALEGL